MEHFLGTSAAFEKHADPLTSCPICGSDTITLAYYSTFKELRIQYDRCRACGFIFQNPLLHQDVLTYIYESKWYWGLEGNPEVGYLNYLKDREKFIKDYERRFHKLLAAGMPSTGRLLDVGCGAGYSTYTAKQAGFSATGIEPSEAMCNFARTNLGVDVAHTIFETCPVEPGSIDVVTTWGTANNFRDPVAIFSQMRTALRPGGWVVMDMFDTSSIFAGLVQANFKRVVNATGRHTRKSLRIAFEKAGFSTCRFIPYVPYFSVSHILQMSPLRHVRFFSQFKDLGIYVPVTGYYLVMATR